MFLLPRALMSCCWGGVHGIGVGLNVPAFLGFLGLGVLLGHLLSLNRLTKGQFSTGE
jgi:hypothetical protein